MRTRASELATDWLGPRTQREIERSRQRETTQDRWTGLDRALSAAARDCVVDLRKVPGDLGRRRHRALLVGRLQYLAQLGLAEKSRGARWTLRPDAGRTLRALGERKDIVRTLQRSFGAPQRHLPDARCSTAVLCCHITCSWNRSINLRTAAPPPKTRYSPCS